MSCLILSALAASAIPSGVLSQQPPTSAIHGSAEIPDARDEPWPGGAMTLDIDARDVTRGVYRVTQAIPLATNSQRITLLFPEWLPGNHGPRGPVAELVDLNFAVDGKAVSWRRDPLDVHAFHVDLPDGARRLTARFIHTSPLKSSEGRVTMTGEMLNLQWEKMSLYPAGHFVRQIRVQPSVTLPDGWKAATALKDMAARGARFTWAETDYETLVDSPIFAGAFMGKWNLGRTVGLSAVADSPGQLDLRADHLSHLSALVDEGLATFGAPPFEKYDFLVALTDRMGGIGLEHLRSSENQLEPRNFTAWDELDWDRNVLAHELVHSWNGKYRRPARLWTPDYRTPMQDDLLWVYEGQTQFWGWVLAARSGLQDKDMVLGMMANAAGFYSELPGRQWRSVGDTTHDPIAAARKPKPYASLARGEDYYNEGGLIWLEVDQIIRQGTGGRKGLDDFARAFFSYRGEPLRLSTYEVEDVIAALSQVHAFDWKGFFDSRIGGTGQPSPVTGVERAGYRLVWKDQPNPYAKARMDHARNLDLYYSLGLTVDNSGEVSAPRWDGPAFQAGIVTGVQIVAVDGLAFNGNRLAEATTRAMNERKPIELLLRRDDRYYTVQVPYFGGLRWPWLERTDVKREAGLDRLLSPRRKGLSQ